MNIIDTYSHLVSQYPMAATALAALIGPLWPKLTHYLITDGLSKVVTSVLTFQSFYLRKIGLPNSEVLVIQQKEVLVLRQAADDIEASQSGLTNSTQL